MKEPRSAEAANHEDKAATSPPKPGADAKPPHAWLPSRADFLASLVVFLVALPLCMGIAIASGVPPALGLVTGIVGGLLVGAIQGAPLQVSGPAAGLVVIIVDLVDKHGLASLGVVVLLAGLMQFVAGLVRGGRWFRAVPPSVVYGMLAGIGVLIFAGQFHVMIDDDPRSGGIANLLAIPEALSKAVSPDTTLSHREAAGIGVLTIVTILAWLRFAPDKIKTFVPGPLAGVLAASLVANLFQLPIAFVSVPGDLLGSLNVPALPTLDTIGVLVGPALGLALVASAETLLSASAVDKMHAGPRANYNRELSAQGIGNMVCGCLGALPMTGVIVRSSANVEAGGKSRWSAVLHGLWLLVLVGVGSQLLTRIPVAALAAVLVYIGAKLASPMRIEQLRPYGRGEIAVFIVTTIAVVATDLLTGVLIGLGLSVAKLLLRLSKLDIVVEDEPEENRTTVHLIGSATFLRLADVAETLEAVSPTRELLLRIDDLEHVDHAILELFRTWADQHASRGGRVVFDWELLERRYHFGQAALDGPERTLGPTPS
ncbi:C4-dicarboxylic acid transporter DauA [Enhygromyxa salina]|uniref:C4-dicarboxylic acid transporter DauA n=1 Tax=Enhygromyxa salina TaxID=215803 RepID=A0A2S9XDJ3_9BACT|nr:SulP family inorganic anion transporter [Enhygromyxa salina]PRP90934.1 C4-dicarboxylic acid transporter DauA [Enhygromyxa salina]